MQQTREGNTLEERIIATTRQASKAVFITSFTTFVAFMTTAITDIIPMSSFGIFAGLLVIMLFVINALLLPPFLVLYARYLENKPWKSLNCCGSSEDTVVVPQRPSKDIELADKANTQKVNWHDKIHVFFFQICQIRVYSPLALLDAER